MERAPFNQLYFRAFGLKNLCKNKLIFNFDLNLNFKFFCLTLYISEKVKSESEREREKEREREGEREIFRIWFLSISASLWLFFNSVFLFDSNPQISLLGLTFLSVSLSVLPFDHTQCVSYLSVCSFVFSYLFYCNLPKFFC